MYEYQMEATDPGGMLDPLVYEVVLGPETLTVSDTGLVTWVPSDLDITLPGEAHRVVLRVSDDDEGSAEEEWEISVSPNRPPTAPRPIYPLDRLRLDLIPRLTVENASDPDFDDLMYFFEVDRSEMFDSPDLQASGEVAAGTGFTTWTPPALETGNVYYWRAWASDGVAESSRNGSIFIFVDTPPPPSPDASVPDAAVQDAGASPDSGTISPPSNDDGCSCTVPGAQDEREEVPWAVLLSLLGLVWARRGR